VPKKWNEISLDIPDTLTPADREALGEDIIDFIYNRTQKGIDKNGKKFPPYSKEYIESLDFKLAGKSKNQVNLTLTGDMLAALDIISHKPGKLTIGISDDNDAELLGRAEGNITGYYGKSSKRKPRNFLGISDEDLERLISFYDR
jgi:hypothetical protein